MVSPQDEVTPAAFGAWLEQLQTGEPIHLDVTAAETLGDVRATGEFVPFRFWFMASGCRQPTES
jgi:hypothetical protein